jgi:hypothetical protein
MRQGYYRNLEELGLRKLTVWSPVTTKDLLRERPESV